MKVQEDDEMVFGKNASNLKQSKSYIYNNDSQPKLLGENTFENLEEGEKRSSISPFRQATVHNYLNEDLSLIEKTAQRVKPIIEALQSYLVQERKFENIDSIDEGVGKSEGQKSHCSEEKEEIIGNIENPEDCEKKPKKPKKIEPDMRIVLGYLNQLEMISNLNIGNVMQIQPIKIEEMLSAPRNETEFNRASFIEKISLL